VIFRKAMTENPVSKAGFLFLSPFLRFIKILELLFTFRRDEMKDQE
jgi:hypothetical protein